MNPFLKSHFLSQTLSNQLKIGSKNEHFRIKLSLVMEIIFLVISLITVAGCKGNQIQTKTINTNCDSTISTGNNKEFSIQLYCAAGSGFSWQILDSQFLTNIKYEKQTFKSINNIPGSDGIQTFYFKPIKKGEAIINFIYVQPFIKPWPTNSLKRCFKIIAN